MNYGSKLENVSFDQYYPLVKKLSMSYAIPYLDFDDYLQEAHMVFFDCLTHYRRERNVSFGLFFKIFLTNRFKNLQRDSFAQKRKVSYYTNYFSEFIDESGEEYITETFYVSENSCGYDKVEYRTYFKEFIQSLSDKEVEVFYKNLTQKGDLQLTHAESCSLSRAKKKFKEIVLHIK